MTLTRTPVRRLVGLAGLLALTCVSAAHAQTTTFAAYRDGGAQSFQAVSNNGILSIAPSTVPVTFDFNPSIGLPTGLLGDQAAHMTISYQGSSSAPSIPPTVTPGETMQPLNTPITISILLNTPYQGLTDLLTVQFTGRLYFSSGSGAVGGVEASVNGSGDMVTYSSDFLNFGNQANDNLAIALNAITPVGTTGGFTASQLGSFASFSPQPAPLSGPFTVTPVPPSAILLSLGLFAPTLAGVRARLRGWASSRRVLVGADEGLDESSI